MFLVTWNASIHGFIIGNTIHHHYQKHRLRPHLSSTTTTASTAIVKAVSNCLILQPVNHFMRREKQNSKKMQQLTITRVYNDM